MKVPFKFNKCPLCGAEKVANGMGPQGEWYTKWIKRLPASRRLRSACKKHDCRYHLGIFDKDRRKADRLFKKDMLFIIRKEVKGFWKRQSYIAFINATYWAVCLGGKDHFNYGGCCKN